MLSGALPLALVVAAAGRGGGVQQQLRAAEAEGLAPARSSSRSSIVLRQPVERQMQTLRLCNAYPYRTGLDVVFVRTKQDLGSLPYKSCGEYQLAMQDGDQIDFKVKGSFVGTFAVSTLPESAKTLVLTVSRRNGTSMGALFQSHAFSMEDKADVSHVAVIDAYQSKGPRLKSVAITDTYAPSEPEEIPMNSVVQIAPGSYQIAMPGGGHKKFTAEPRKSYVLIHVGRKGEGVVDARQPNGTSSLLETFDEDFVIYPRAESSSGTRVAAASLGLILLLAVQAVVGLEL